MEQFLGFAVGLLSGFVWEKLATTPYQNSPTLFPSLLINNSKNVIHLHHWLLYAIGLVVLVVWSIKTDRLLHPAALFVITFLSTAIFYQVITSPDWWRIVK